MTIPFTTFPDTRIPHVGVEIERGTSQTSLAVQPYKVLAIAQRTTAGTVPALTPVRVFSAEQASVYHGVGSPMHLLCKTFLLNNRTVELWTIAQTGTGTAATSKITVTGPATGAGVIALYIGGQRLTVDVANTATATAVAALIVAAINALTDLPCTAAVNGTNAFEVDLTYRVLGTVGNKLDVRHSFKSGESLPSGIGLTITAFAGGAGEPDVDAVWPVIGDEHYNFMVVQYSSTGTMDKLKTELADRWGPVRSIESVAYMALEDTHANLITAGDARNDEFLEIIGVNDPAAVSRGGLEQPFQWTAAQVGQLSLELNRNPGDQARPVQTLPLRGITAPTPQDRFDFWERDALLRKGISTWTVDASGVVRIERAITTYQTTAQGVPDDAFLDVETIYTLAYCRFDWRAFILDGFPRHKLADTNEGLSPGQPVMTRLLGKALAVARYRLWASFGLVEDVEGFKQNVRCERHDTDRNRLNWLMPINPVNGLRVRAALFQFIL